MTEQERVQKLSEKFFARFKFAEPRISISDQIPITMPSGEKGQSCIQIRDRATGEELGISTEGTRKGELIYTLNHSGKIFTQVGAEALPGSAMDMARHILGQNRALRDALATPYVTQAMSNNLRQQLAEADENISISPTNIEGQAAKEDRPNRQ